jgi:hypothetical protein
MELAEDTWPRGLPCQSTDKADNINFYPLHICRVALLLLRQHRGAVGNGLGTTITYLRCTTSGATDNGLDTTIKYLRQITSGAAGNGLVAKIKYLRRTTSGAAGNGLDTTAKYLRGNADTGMGTTIKHLRRATSGAVGDGLSQSRGLLLSPFTTNAPHSPFIVLASVAQQINSNAEVRGLSAECVCMWGPS